MKSPKQGEATAGQGSRWPGLHPRHLLGPGAGERAACAPPAFPSRVQTRKWGAWAVTQADGTLGGFC